MIRKLPLNSKAVTKRLTFFIITAFLISPAFGQKYVEMMADETVNFFEVQKEANKYFDSVGTERGNGYKQYKRWEYETSLNIDEYGNRLSTKQIEEETQKVVARLKNARTSKIAATTWTELGPTYKNPTSGWNPGVGRVSAIAVEPVNKQLIYVGTPEGGLWKSTNGGSTWTPMFDQNTNMKIFAIAMDPNNSNIVYVGTEGAGLYKTTNGGSSWTTINFTSSKIGKIIINPNNTANLLAATKNGIYRSTNSGSNWTRTYTASVEDIEFKPGDVNTVYATGDYCYRSTNNGQNWSQITNGISGSGRSLVAVTQANPNYVYIVQADNSSYGKTYRSTDSGVSFTTVNSGSSGSNNLFGYETDGSGTGGQAWYDMALCVSPTDANEVHLGGIICWKSTNGGSTFTATTAWTWGNSIGYNHADVHVLEYVGNTIYAGTDGGIYISTNKADDWTDLSNGLGIRQFYRIGVCKNNENVITGGAQDNGSTVYMNGTWKDWLGGDGMEGFVDHNNTNTLYGTAQYGSLYKSINGGDSRFSLPKPEESGNWVTPFLMDPNVSTTLYVGYVQIYKSTTSGSSWTKISNFAGTTKANDIQVSPSNSDYIYVIRGTSMFVTKNGGTSWSSMAASPNGNPNSIAIHPTNPEKIALATSTGKVYLSTNGGTNWTDYSNGLPSISAYKVVFDKRAESGIYVGMTRGVYYRDNTMSEWNPYIFNLPYAPVYDLEYHEKSKRIYAATHGRGLWWAPAYDQPPIECNILQGTPFGTSPAWNNGSNTFDKAFDGDITTAFDYINANGGYTGLDLGGPKTINGIRFYPRANWASRMVGGKFQASNSSNFSSGVVDLYTITSTPSYEWQEFSVTTSTKYRYIRYLSPNNGFCNIAEIEICGINEAPTVSITAPANNATYTAPVNITISATASDPDGAITKVEFYRDEVYLGEDATSPYTFTWNNVTVGTYKLTAKAISNDKGTATSSQISITVNNALPTVSITEPGNNATFTAPASINIKANASDANGNITKVEFYKDGVYLGEDADSPYVFAWNNVPVGNYQITAKAIDNHNGSTTSAVVNITVNLSGTENCTTIAPWKSNAIYVSDNYVTYNNYKYKALGWTQNNTPSNSPVNWENVGECIDGTEISNHPDVSMTPSGSTTLLLSDNLSMNVTGLSSGTAQEVTYVIYNGTSVHNSITKTSPGLSANWSPNELGNYQLQVIVKNENGMLIYGNPVDITVTSATGYHGSTSSESIFVIPNPNNGVFNLSGIYEELIGALLEVTDMLGQKIHEEKIQNTNGTISIHNLKAGMYLIKITNNEKVLLTKFEVN